MSRGPSRIERAIRALFDAHPDLAFVTDELSEHCYPGEVIGKKHQVAVLRAAWKVLKHDPDWSAKREWGDKGNRYRFFNRDSVVSRSADTRPHTRFRPVDYVWKNYQHYRAKVPKAVSEQRLDERRQRLYAEHPEMEIHDKAWLDTMRREDRERVEGDAAWHRLLRDSDEAARQRLVEAECEIWRQGPDIEHALHKARRAWITHPDVWLKRYQNRARKELETHTPVTEPIIMPPPPEAKRLADLARRLITENDPDAIRAGLAEVADALDQMAGERADDDA
jgi:hypothetical protein